jgi:TonB family protein
MLAYLATQRVKRVAGHLRLKLDLDSTPSLAAGCSEFCRPELDNREEISRVLGGANSQAQRSGRVMLWVFVTVAGRVGKIEVRESSGDDMVDGLAMGVARAMRFKPARADYVPIPVWVAIPVNLGTR